MPPERVPPPNALITLLAYAEASSGLDLPASKERELPQHALSEMELKTLYAAMSLGDRAAATDVLARIVESGRPILRSNFYTVLNALERKGYIVSEVDRSTTRGHPHNVRVLTVTDAGVAAATAERRMYAALARGAEDRLDRRA